MHHHCRKARYRLESFGKLRAFTLTHQLFYDARPQQAAAWYTKKFEKFQFLSFSERSFCQENYRVARAVALPLAYRHRKCTRATLNVLLNCQHILICTAQRKVSQSRVRSDSAWWECNRASQISKHKLYLLHAHFSMQTPCRKRRR